MRILLKKHNTAKSIVMFLIICVFSLFFTICNLHLYINFTVFIELFN